MAKPTLADRITAAIAANDTKTGLIRMGPVTSRPARSYLTGTDTYEDKIGPPALLDTFSPGSARPMFQVYEQQQAHIPVTQLTKSGVPNSNAVGALQGGLTQNPQAPAATWAAVPQMILPVNAKGPIQIFAAVTVKSSVGSDPAGFAIYRDGNLIGNHVNQTLPSVIGAATAVQLSVTDNPPIGQHVYAMYWSPGTGNLMAVSNYRNMYVVNLTPQ